MKKFKDYLLILFIFFVFIANLNNIKDLINNFFSNDIIEENKIIYIEKKLKDLVNSGDAENGFIVIFNNQDNANKDKKFTNTKIITASGITHIKNFIIFDESIDYMIVNKCFINSFVEDEKTIWEKNLNKKITRIFIRCPIFLNESDKLIGFYGISKHVNIFDVELAISKLVAISKEIQENMRK